MHSFWERMKWNIQHFMQGRYGQDRLSMHLYLLGCLLVLTDMLVGGTSLYLLGLLVLV